MIERIRFLVDHDIENRSEDRTKYRIFSVRVPSILISAVVAVFVAAAKALAKIVIVLVKGHIMTVITESGVLIAIGIIAIGIVVVGIPVVVTIGPSGVAFRDMKWFATINLLGNRMLRVSALLR